MILSVPRMLIGGGVLFALLLAAYLIGRWGGDPYNPDQPPEEIPPEDVHEGFGQPEIPLYERPFKRAEPVRRRGVSVESEEIREEVEEFAQSVLSPDTLAPPRFPRFDGVVERDGRLRLGVARSDGRYETREFQCEPRCQFGARDTTMYAHSQRTLGRLPAILKDVAICGAFAGGSYLVAEIAEYEHPEYVLGGAAGLCALVKIY